MAAQWFIPSGVMPLSGVMVDEDGTDEYFIPALGMFNEDQAAAPAPPAVPGDNNAFESMGFHTGFSFGGK